MISKFADDSKIRGIVDSAQNLQWDLDLPGKWLRNGKTRSNSYQYAVSHFGKTNQGRTFIVNGKAVS